MTDSQLLKETAKFLEQIASLGGPLSGNAMEHARRLHELCAVSETAPTDSEKVSSLKGQLAAEREHGKRLQGLLDDARRANESLRSNSSVLNALRGLSKAVKQLAEHFDKPVTDENVVLWLALNSAQEHAEKVLTAGASAPSATGATKGGDANDANGSNTGPMDSAHAVTGAAHPKNADTGASAGATPRTALEHYESFSNGIAPKRGDALERLRFFCSFAMNGQDWLDAERFFDDVGHELEAARSAIGDTPDYQRIYLETRENVYAQCTRGGRCMAPPDRGSDSNG